MKAKKSFLEKKNVGLRNQLIEKQIVIRKGITNANH